MRDENLYDLQLQFPDIDGVWNFSDLALSENTIRNLLPPSIESNASLDQRSLELLTQLARAQALQQKFPEAKQTLDQVKNAIANRQVQNSKRVEIRYLLEQGRLYWLTMAPVQAQACFNQALASAVDSRETYFTIDAAYMLSLTQPPKSQKERLLKAINFAENSSSDECKLWLSQLYLISGWNSFDLHRFDEALELFSKVYSLSENSGNKARALKAKWGMGRTLRAQGKLKEALEVQRDLMTDLNSLGQTDGYVFLELGECFQALKEPVEAQRYFEMAYQELFKNQWFKDNKATDLARIKHLGKAK